MKEIKIIFNRNYGTLKVETSNFQRTETLLDSGIPQRNERAIRRLLASCGIETEIHNIGPINTTVDGQMYIVQVKETI